MFIKASWPEILGTGALKESSIDTQCPNDHCTDFLRHAFHAEATDIDIGDDAINDTERVFQNLPKVTPTCHSRFGGLCQHTSEKDVICKLVRVLNNKLSEHSLHVGSLLSFTSSSNSFFGFLGVCLQRPQVQTFVTAHLDNAGDHVSILKEGDTSGRPYVLTSHQLFNDLGVSLQNVVEVSVWEYEVLLHGDGLIIHTSAVAKTFTLDPCVRIQTKKPRRKLRFGQRAPTQKKRASKKMNTDKKISKEPLSKKQRKERSLKHAAPETQADASSSEVGASVTSSETTIDSDSDMLGDDGDFAEADVPVPISESSAREEAEAVQLIQEHEFSKDDIAEATESLGGQASSSSQRVPENGKGRKDSGGKGSTRGTYFSRSEGVDSVSLAVSARSKCHFCENRIAKDTVRFCYYHNAYKPSAWVHSACLPHLLKRDGRIQQGIEKLEHLRRESNFPASHAASLSATVQDLLQVLNAQR